MVERGKKVITEATFGLVCAREKISSEQSFEKALCQIARHLAIMALTPHLRIHWILIGAGELFQCLEHPGVVGPSGGYDYAPPSGGERGCITGPFIAGLRFAGHRPHSSKSAGAEANC